MTKIPIYTSYQNHDDQPWKSDLLKNNNRYNIDTLYFLKDLIYKMSSDILLQTHQVYLAF